MKQSRIRASSTKMPLKVQSGDGRRIRGCCRDYCAGCPWTIAQLAAQRSGRSGKVRPHRPQR
ncbi:MAG: hypothetical protein M3442_10830 [Chloroflexota bacterium]|nr:hypothetical protein [Chloroflexota bacterium]